MAARREWDSLSTFSNGSSIRIPHTPIEADSDDDNDSELSSTTSLRDSLVGFIADNGRLYNSHGDYLLPSDDIESERLTLQYVVLQQLFGNKTHFAPVTRPRRILDIGTGTGAWCLDIAKTFPGAHIDGTDIVQQTERTELPNVHWLMENANNENWGRRKYDYIHTRILMGAFEDFRTIIRRSFDNLHPGGYMESQEMWTRPMCDDGTMDSSTHKLTEYTQYLDQAFMEMHKPLRIANKLKRWYQDAGFIDVKEEVMRIPINGWPRDPRFKMLGKYWAKSLLDGLEGFAMKAFTGVHRWTPAEVQVYLVDVRNSIKDKSIHAYHSIHVVYGRKPTDAEQKVIDERRARQAAVAARQSASRDNSKYAVQPPSFPSSDAHDHQSTTQTNGHNGNTNGRDGHQHVPQQPGRSSANSNRRPRQPFSAFPHPNA